MFVESIFLTTKKKKKKKKKKKNKKNLNIKNPLKKKKKKKKKKKTLNIFICTEPFKNDIFYHRYDTFKSDNGVIDQKKTNNLRITNK